MKNDNGSFLPGPESTAGPNQRRSKHHGASGRGSLGLLSLILVFIISGAVLAEKGGGVSAKKSTLTGPSQSSPIALSSDEEFLVNVNPDANSITIFRALP